MASDGTGRLWGAVPSVSCRCDDDQREDDEEAAGEEDATVS